MKYIDLRERTKEDILKIVMEKNIEIERLNKELEKYKYSADELNEIERLNNIIQEVREYLDIDENIRKTCKRYDVNGIAILEILDKENKNENRY